MEETAKPIDFGPIEDDYHFYLANTDETECQLRAFGRYLDCQILPDEGPLRFLDFGWRG